MTTGNLTLTKSAKSPERTCRCCKPRTGSPIYQGRPIFYFSARILYSYFLLLYQRPIFYFRDERLWWIHCFRQRYLHWWVTETGFCVIRPIAITWELPVCQFSWFIAHDLLNFHCTLYGVNSGKTVDEHLHLIYLFRLHFHQKNIHISFQSLKNSIDIVAVLGN